MSSKNSYKCRQKLLFSDLFVVFKASCTFILYLFLIAQVQLFSISLVLNDWYEITKLCNSRDAQYALCKISNMFYLKLNILCFKFYHKDDRGKSFEECKLQVHVIYTRFSIPGYVMGNYTNLKLLQYVACQWNSRLVHAC